MNIRILFIVVLFAMQPLSAQTISGQKEVWKKTVARVIDMRIPSDGKQHALKNAGADSTLLEMFVSAVKARKLTAYSEPEFTAGNILSMTDFNRTVWLENDTITVIDPTDNSEKITIIKHDFNYDSSSKVRVLEEWTFNPSTGKTDIQIVGLAPIQPIYGDGGDFRGVRALFWVRWSDVQSILARYDQYHPGQSLAFRVWDDYFLSDVKPGKTK